MRTRKTIVYLSIDGEWVPSGQLKLIEDGNRSYSVFNYGRRYLERPDAVSVDPVALPLQAQEFVTDSGLFGGIRDAAPDGWGRHLLKRAAEPFGIHLSDFDFLTLAGDDYRVGALGFGPDLSGPRRVRPKWFPREIPGEHLDLAQLVEEAHLAVEDEDELSPEVRRFLVRGSSSAFGGARPKAAVEIEGKHYLAKFSREGESWETVRIEHANMQLASRCGINVPQTQVVSAAGRDVFLIERFDRVPVESGPLHRRHFVTAQSILRAGDDEHGSYDALALVYRQVGGTPAVRDDLRELFRRMVMNVLCNNSDDHLRNHGFIYTPEYKGWRISPAYDVVPQPEIDPDEPHKLYLSVGKQGRVATIKNALSKCDSFGLHRDEATRIAEDMAMTVATEWESLYRECGVPARNFPELRNSFREAERYLRARDSKEDDITFPERMS
jgi:serine/threonine-protein kinase HipA